MVESAVARPTGRAMSYLLAVYAVAAVEWHRIRREPTLLLVRAAQPLLWLLVFGAAVSRVRGLGPPGLSYQAYLVPGVIAQAVLFVALSSGLSVIWERDLGVTQRMVTAPAATSAVVLGKAVGAGLRALLLVLLLLAAVAVAGVPLPWTASGLAGASGVTVLGAALFSGLAMLVASLARSRERFMGLGQLIVLPAFFASNALYPLSLMPDWLQYAARLNPLTYHVDLLRWQLLGVGQIGPVVSLVLLAGGTAVALSVAAMAYPRRVL